MMHPLATVIVFCNRLKNLNFAIMKQLRLFILFPLLAIIASCNYYGPCIDGTGPIKTEVRNISGFTGIGNAASFEVFITQSNHYQVEVEAQENLLPYIETYVSGTTLIVETEDDVCLRNTVPVRIYVSMPVVKILSLAGSGGIFSDVIEADEMELILAGSGRIKVDTIFCNHLITGNSASGSIFNNYIEAESMQVHLSGSGIIETGLVFEPSDISITHSASGTIRMSVENGSELTGTLSGSGRIMLYGEVTKSTFVNSASGKIDALDLLVRSCTATNAGSGTIFVNVVDFLQATIAGSGDIVYRGDPQLSYIITGSGSLRRY